jgi:hypothetical protein
LNDDGPSAGYHGESKEEAPAMPRPDNDNEPSLFKRFGMLAVKMAGALIALAMIGQAVGGALEIAAQ